MGPEADCHTLGVLPLELLVGGSQEFKSWVPLNKNEQGRITNYSAWTDIIRQFASGQLLPDLCADTDALQEEMDMARAFMAVASGSAHLGARLTWPAAAAVSPPSAAPTAGTNATAAPTAQSPLFLQSGVCWRRGGC